MIDMDTRSLSLATKGQQDRQGHYLAVLRIRIRGIRIFSLDPDPDPYKKMAGFGIRIRIK